MKKKSVNPAMAMMAARAMRTPVASPMAVNPLARPRVSRPAPMAPPAPSEMPGMPGMKKGGQLKKIDSSKNPGLSKLPTNVRNKMGYMKKGGMSFKEGGMMDKAQDKAMIKKAFKMHDSQEHKGEHTDLSKLRKGGMMKMAKGGMNKFEKSGKDVEKKGMKEGSKSDMALDKKQMMGMKKGGMSKGCGYASGGKASQLSKANGIAVRGKTRGKIC
jgi:hypothetical protein